MRKIAFTTNDNQPIKKVMIYESEPGMVYLFGYDTVLDSHGLFDEWFETVEQAELECMNQYGIGPEDWIMVDDPQEGCPDDIIGPVPIK